MVLVGKSCSQFICNVLAHWGLLSVYFTHNVVPYVACVIVTCSLYLLVSWNKLFTKWQFANILPLLQVEIQSEAMPCFGVNPECGINARGSGGSGGASTKGTKPLTRRGRGLM